MRRASTLTFTAALLGLLTACTAGSEDGSVFGSGGGAGTGGGGGAGNGGNASTTQTTSSSGFEAGVGGGSGIPGCDAGPDEDRDQDGFTITAGDCNDCDPNVNPNAVEVATPTEGGGGEGGGPPEPADENCDGQVDEAPTGCDDAIALDSMDPNDAARAVGLCKFATSPTDWGVVNAAWVMVDGSPPPTGAAQLANFHLGHGNLTAFGPNVQVREGTKMLAVSSGTGRQPSDPGYASPGGFSKGYSSGHPQGFPKESPSCPGTVTGTPNDGTAVEITVRKPSNAQGFSFDFDFYTYEWPVYVCSQFNDFFVAILSPVPAGQTDGNISFDQLGNPVSVNNAFVQVCGCSGGPPCIAGGKSFACALGNTELVGTGFEGHAATSWLQTQAPIPDDVSEITIRWGTYDSGDGILDSTTLVDNWRWIAEPGTTIGTTPLPPPQ
jgi:hypothetical protein